MSPAPPDLDALEGLPPLAPEAESELAEELAAAFDPAPIDPRRHAAILAACLEDPLAPPSEAELRAASELARGLEAGAAHGDAGLARSLRHAAGGGEHAGLDRAVERALGGGKPRSNVVFAAFGAAAGFLALAAGIAIVVAPAAREAAPSAADARSFASSRSLAPLFEGGAEGLDESARIDRIERARARELRENRYLAWGVR